MKLCIKNMVCDRCTMIVRSILTVNNLHINSIKLGEVTIEEDSIDKNLAERINKQLSEFGFEWLQDKKNVVVEKAKNLIIDFVINSQKINSNLSTYLCSELGMDYSQISHFFSEIENTTIEKFYILQRVEKVKELISYNELTLSEISFKLNYSSVAHLSKQFKSVVGVTPSEFKNRKDKHRISIDKV